MTSASLNPNLRDFWQCDGKMLPSRHKILFGGRASSKSYEFAGMAAFIASKYKTKFLCVRRYQNKIKESVYTLIKHQIDRFGLTGFDVQASAIYHKNGSEFVFYGVQHSTDEIKSFEGADVMWCEESNNLTEEQWKVLEPTIRKEGSEIWISFNPGLVTDFVWQHFVMNTPSSTIKRHINYDENPFLSKTMLDVINELKAKDYESYEHIYLGKPLTDDDNVIIKRQWVEAAIGLKLEGGRKVIGYDVADSGDDKNAVAISDSVTLHDIYEWKGGENELKKSADRVRLEAIKHKAHVIYDSIGVGAHTGSTLQASGFHQFSGFNAGGKVVKPVKKYNGVKQREYFSNIKAQAWWLVADRFRNTYDHVMNGTHYESHDLIAINPDIKCLEQLISELTVVRRDFDKAGRVKVESKDDLKGRGIMSPNLADAFIMSFIISLINNSQVSDLEITGF